MTLKEAIQTSQYHLKYPDIFHDERVLEAHRLGIEALKRLQHTRKYTSLRDVSLLPGETKDNQE